jgi:hypothetical protein
MTTSDASLSAGSLVDRQAVNKDDEGKNRNRGLLIVIVLLVAILILLLLEISGAFGYRVITAISQATGLSIQAIERGPEGPAGPQGLAGSDGANGLQGANGLTGGRGVIGAAGQNGLPGINGADGANGADGRDGVDGARGPQGEPGTVLAVEQGLIGIGACDSDISVAIKSRFDAAHADFLLDRVRFGDVAEACWGRTITIYVFSGGTNSYVVEGVATDFVIPSSSAFAVPYTAFAQANIPSATLTKLAVELSEAE